MIFCEDKKKNQKMNNSYVNDFILQNNMTKAQIYTPKMFQNEHSRQKMSHLHFNKNKFLMATTMADVGQTSKYTHE